ncbi:MAG: peptidoglycan-binding protein [Rhodobacteraceae bacterium]|nr:peptidoglycan-binding protein [Paracoccaceae bacterium]
MANPSGAKLEKIQEMLNEKVKPKPPLTVDGKWGKNTSAALKLLQAKAKIPTSGEVDAATGLVITRVLKTGKIEKEQPVLFITHGGKTIGYTQKQYDKLKKDIIAKLKSGPMLSMRQAANAAKAEWDVFDKLNNDQWIVTWCIEATRGANLPPDSMIKNALSTVKYMESYLASGNIAKFHSEQKAAEKICNIAIDKMRAYRNTMIEGGGNWVTALEWTKTGAFTFLGVFAAPVAAGALGTGALASAVIGGAAVSATQSAASEIGKGSAGTKNWTAGGALANVLIDTGVGAIIGVFNKGGSGGKHIFEATLAKIGPKLAAEQGFKTLSKETAKRFAAYLITEGAKSTTEGAIKDAASAAKGDKKMTMEKFASNVATNFLKGMALGPLGNVVGKYGKGLIPKKFQTKIWDLALKAVSKSSGGSVHIGEIDKKAIEMAEKLVGDMIKMAVDKAVSDALKGAKGPMDAKKLEKKLEEQLFSPKQMKIYVTIATKEAKKAMKKKK